MTAWCPESDGMTSTCGSTTALTAMGTDAESVALEVAGCGEPEEQQEHETNAGNEPHYH